MKRSFKILLILIAILLLLVGGLYVYFKFLRNQQKDPKINVQYRPKKHPVSFNTHIDSTIAIYLNIKDAFIEADTATAKNETRKFINMVQNIDTMELKKDTLPVYITNIGYRDLLLANAEDLLIKTDITDMRYSFRDISDNLRALMISINYEGRKLFVQKCPMAFNDTESATWISNSEEIYNPYLGKFHPKYQAGMLHCGEVAETIEQK
jgi:hypothetical protein